MYGTTNTKVPKGKRSPKLIGGDKNALKNIKIPKKKEDIQDRLYQGYPRFRTKFPYEVKDQLEKKIKEKIKKKNLARKKQEMEAKYSDKNHAVSLFQQSLKQDDSTNSVLDLIKHLDNDQECKNFF